MTVAVLGAGAFGTALAITLSRTQHVILWGRDADAMAHMRSERENTSRLPGCRFPGDLEVTADIDDVAKAETLLVAVPLQTMRRLLADNAARFGALGCVACCKGIELASGATAPDIIQDTLPNVTPALLTGPSFARDIAEGLPTALTLACADADAGTQMQHRLSTPTLRLYRSTDLIGAALGGSLKNVIAIACGAAIGAGLGESARAAIMTRGYAEMRRLAVDRGADPETLTGLSGFGDLALTCTSDQSRNYRFGLALGRAEKFDPAITVEGAATARALAQEAAQSGRDLPIATAVAALVENRLDVPQAMAALLSRSLKEE